MANSASVVRRTGRRGRQNKKPRSSSRVTKQEGVNEIELCERISNTKPVDRYYLDEIIYRANIDHEIETRPINKQDKQSKKQTKI